MRPTAKHELFAQYLADGMVQHEAYLKAGFVSKGQDGGRAAAAMVLRRNVNIRERATAILAERAKDADKTREKAVDAAALSLDGLIADLVRVKDMAMSAVPVLDPKGIPTGEYRTDNANAIKAITTLGQQMFGAFVSKSQAVPADKYAGLPRDVVKEMEEAVAKIRDARRLSGADAKGARRTH